MSWLYALRAYPGVCRIARTPPGGTAPSAAPHWALVHWPGRAAACLCCARPQRAARLSCHSQPCRGSHRSQAALRNGVLGPALLLSAQCQTHGKPVCRFLAGEVLMASPAVHDEHGAVVPVALRMLLAVQADAGEAPGAAQDGVRSSPLAPPAHPVCVPAPCDRAFSAAGTRSLSCSQLPAQPGSQLVSRQVRVQLQDPSSRLPRSF